MYITIGCKCMRTTYADFFCGSEESMDGSGFRWVQVLHELKEDLLCIPRS